MHKPPGLNATAGDTDGVYTVMKFEDAGLSFGDYVVCIMEPGQGMYVPVPGPAGPFLTIVPEFPTDAVTVPGFFKEQQFTVMKDVPASVAILGSKLTTDGKAAIALSKSGSCSTAKSIADWDHKLWVRGHVGLTETGSAVDSSTFDITVMAEPSTYEICMCDASAATAGADNSPKWNEPTKAYLDYYGVDLTDVLQMTIAGMVDNHTNAGTGQFSDTGMTLKAIIDGIHGTTFPTTGTSDEAYWMFIAAFQKSGLTFEEIADSIINVSVSTTSPAESMFALDLIDGYAIKPADLLWLAHIATVEGLPSAELIADLKMNSTFTENFVMSDTGPRNEGPKRETTISMKVPTPTKGNLNKKGFAVVASNRLWLAYVWGLGTGHAVLVFDGGVSVQNVG
jgi:hypothetical protein